MNLIVALGNIGSQYEQTRHNIGFMSFDYYFKSLESSIDFTFENKFNSIIIRIKYNIFIKPLTYMNNSGQAVSDIFRFYKLDFTKDRILVIHDDLDLAFSKIKIKFSGNSGGHNGLNSIDKYIGPDYYRLRVGIGRPKNILNVSNDINDISKYVLTKFNKDELEILNTTTFIITSQIINDFIMGKSLLELQNKYNNKIR